MSFDEIHIDSKELIEKHPMDSGGFGMVSLCHRKNHGLVVLKTVYTGPQRMEYKGSLLEEGKMMHKLNHDRVIKLIGVILEEGNYSLVMEFMVNGNLLQLLMSVTIPLPVKGRIILEIIDGMTYLHIMNIVHKDLKPENILVDADYHIKIADLGVSIFRTWSRLTTEELKRRCQMSSKPQNNAGTLAYLAPEHLQSLNAKATEKSDVYSFAIVMWVILTNREPYENALNNTQVMNLVIKGERPDLSLIPDEPPEKMVSLMQGCWANEPEKRPTFAECNEEFQPFYKKNLQKYIDESVETLRKLSQNRPTASRELMKRMKSLQVDCVGIMPDIPPKESRNQNEPGPRNGNFLLNPTTHFDYRQPGSLKYFSQDASPNILMSDAKGVQIGNNNTLYIGKRSYHRRKETMNTQNLEILNDNPVKESHLDLLRGELGKDWKHCARKLGFRESEIDEIDHDYERDGLKEKVFKMLYKWQMKEGLKGATVGKLVQALNSCNRSDLTLSLQNCL
ncbi:receptor-interacting serine/threonine-protein kinase 1 isoform X5 [Narcine bancroftii]|uniref:receptor-interacting serine/threonine-protein kinase 1 isoform X5 n=1 Tax=Narcine bancroftii TaxID=1343680 RepID=UPI003831A2C4